MKRAQIDRTTTQQAAPGGEPATTAGLPRGLLQRKISRRIQRKAAAGPTVGPELDPDPDNKLPELHYQKIEGQAVIGKIEPRDVLQGSLGDCGFMAALASVAATSPETIRDGIKSLGNGLFLVRLYRKQWAGMGKDPTFVEQWMALNSDMPVSASGKMVYGSSDDFGTEERVLDTYVDNKYNAMVGTSDEKDIPSDAKRNKEVRQNPNDRELWPSLYEKAATGMSREWRPASEYAKGDPGAGKRGEQAGGYDELKGFPSDEALSMITGRPAKTEKLGSAGGGGDVFERMKQAARANQPISAATIGDPSDVATDDGFYPGHVYTVLAVEGSEILLRNPFGYRLVLKDKERLATKSISFPKDDHGEFRVARAVFLQAFAEVTIGGRSQKTAATS